MRKLINHIFKMSYNKGNGGEIPNGSYFFIELSINKSQVCSLSSPYHLLLKTSDAIESYLRSKFTTINKMPQDKMRLLYLLIQKKTTTTAITLLDDSMLGSNIYEKILGLDLKLFNITRHHLIEANQYLQELHNLNLGYDFSDGNSWFPGNLLLGPSPEYNFHDGTKSQKQCHLHYQEQQESFKKVFPNFCIIDSDHTRHALEIFPLLDPNRISSGAIANIENIKKFMNIYVSVIFECKMIGLHDETKNKLINTWKAFDELKSMTAVWSPSVQFMPPPYLKLKATMILELEDNILVELNKKKL